MCSACFNILALIAFGAISAGLTALVPTNLPVKTGRKNSDTQILVDWGAQEPSYAVYSNTASDGGSVEPPQMLRAEKAELNNQETARKRPLRSMAGGKHEAESSTDLVSASWPADVFPIWWAGFDFRCHGARAFWQP